MQSQNARKKIERKDNEERCNAMSVSSRLVSIQPANLRWSGFIIISIDLDRDPNVVYVCSPTAYEFQAVISQQIPA